MTRDVPGSTRTSRPQDERQIVPNPTLSLEDELELGHQLSSICVRCNTYFAWCKCPDKNVDKIVPATIRLMGMEAQWYGELFRSSGEINTGFGYY